MTRTQQTIARQIRRDIEQHSELAMGCLQRSNVTQDEYCASRAVSDRAVSMARYLGQHMQGIDRRSWGAACGVRIEA